MLAFKMIWKAAVAFYDEMFPFLLMGLLTLIGCVLILPGPFVIAGLYGAAQKAVRGEGVKWANYWQGLKEFGLRTWLLLIIVVAVYGILYLNFWFYTTSEISPFSEQLGLWLVPLWFILALVWTGTAYYAQSFLMELQEPKIFAVFRSSLFLAILHPFVTLILVVISALVLVLSVAFPVLLILTPAFVIILALTSIRMQITQLLETTAEKEESDKSVDSTEPYSQRDEDKTQDASE